MLLRSVMKYEGGTYMYPIKSQNENITITETLFEMSDGVKLYTRITAPAKGEQAKIAVNTLVLDDAAFME